MTPSPDPDPDPDPEPTSHSVTFNITDSWTASLTTWLQAGDNWGSDIVSGSSTTEKNGTHQFTCPAGEYYLFSAPNDMSRAYCTMKVNGTTINKSIVTNGQLSGWRSGSKITIAADTTITVIVEKE